MDRNGDILHVLTFRFQNNTSTIIEQPLANGVPAGAPVTTPLPQAAFGLLKHPSLDVIYSLNFGSFTKLNYDRVTGSVTVGTTTSAFGLNSAVITPDGASLYYVSAPNRAICRFALDPQGSVTGSATCNNQPGNSLIPA